LDTFHRRCCAQNMELHYLFTSANPKHTLPSDVISRRTTFFQPILPPAAPAMRPDSLPRRWPALYKSLTLLTYLVAYVVLSHYSFTYLRQDGGCRNDVVVNSFC